MLQINTIWKLSKMTLIRACEQRWSKTFYFGEPNFVELLGVMGSPPKILWNFRKCLNAPFNSLKLLEDRFAIKENGARGFRETLSSPHCRHRTVAHAALPPWPRPARSMPWPRKDKKLRRSPAPHSSLSPAPFSSRRTPNPSPSAMAAAAIVALAADSGRPGAKGRFHLHRLAVLDLHVEGIVLGCHQSTPSSPSYSRPDAVRRSDSSSSFHPEPNHGV